MARRRPVTIILAVLAVLALVAAGMSAARFLRVPGDIGGGTPVSESPTADATPAADTPDPATVLENAGFNVVLPPPVPQAPEVWGDYLLDGSGEGTARLTAGNDVAPLPGFGRPGTAVAHRDCAAGAFLVSFRAPESGATVLAQLRSEVGSLLDEATLSSGWMLGNRCSVPYLGAADLPAGVGAADVEYTVRVYRHADGNPRDPRAVSPRTHAPQPPEAPSS